MNYKEKAKLNMLNKERYLSKYATLSNDAIRLKEEKDDDIRTDFYRDIDRIMYSLSFLRYQNKTQVFSFKENDHIAHRMIHVQFVSRIAKTIGRALNLNEDLIEAIALGHDIGHTPLGHTGEAMLNKISRRELGEYFAHNIQSVRNLMFVEKNGNGLNLSLQVLDGIFTHNGEILEPIYKPMDKSVEEFLEMYEDSYTDLAKSKTYSAMTLEGCVVRISDIIAYVGRDIEDAIRLRLIKKSDIPEDITKVLGTKNSEIINTIIMDIIKNSIDKPYIKISDDVYKALLDLKQFNSDYIYKKSMTLEEYAYYENGMIGIFNKYVKDLDEGNKDSNIHKMFLGTKSDEYKKNTNHKRMALDFIAGMTDKMFDREVKMLAKNEKK